MKIIISFILLSIVAFRPATHNLQPATRRLQQIYTAELGIREATGRNDGNRVEAYLKYVRLQKGNPWCAAFVCYCLGKAGIPNPRSGYCPSMFPAGKVIWTRGLKAERAESRKQKVESTTPTTRSPQSGDVFGLYFPDKGRIAHVGFVDDWGDTYALTVEGNTNEAGSREGNGVYRKRRLISSIYKVARY